MIKRQMFGRANFDLLRKRVILLDNSKAQGITKFAPEAFYMAIDNAAGDRAGRGDPAV